MKPRYRTFNGAGDLPLAPPFRSLGLRIEYLALPASLEKLRALCDRLLNFADDPAGPPPEAVGRFAPLSPFVYLMVCRHPHLAVARDDYGWFAQTELTFGFPAGWYQRRPWGWALERWAWVNPYIYLDNFLGLGTGREVDGWPKKPCHFVEGGGSLVAHAAEVARPGEPMRPSPLVEVRANVPASPHEAWRQWAELQAEACRAYASAVREMPAALGPWVRALAAPTDLWRLGRTAVEGVLDANIVTLKQFRSVGDPAGASYQALVRSVMQVDRVLGAGPMGGAALALGDPSGGHRVRVWRYPTDPIVETLGLRPERVDVVDGVEVATLRPAFPFWMTSDITYPCGEVLCSRFEDTAWELGHRTPRTPGGPARFNEALGASDPCRRGPFSGDDITVRAVALRADPARLAALCERYYAAAGVDVEPLGEHAYVAFLRGLVTSGDPASPDLRWEARSAAVAFRARFDGVEGLLVPFVFAGDAVSQVTTRELGGGVAALAELTGAWSDGDGPHLRVTTAAFPALFTGAEGKPVAVLEVARADAPPRAALPVALPKEGALALHTLDLKQYRDAEDPSRAAWRRVEVESVAVKLRAPAAPLDADLAVRVRDTPTWAIATLLGLHGEADPADPGALVCHAEGGFEARFAFVSERPAVRG